MSPFIHFYCPLRIIGKLSAKRFIMQLEISQESIHIAQGKMILQIRLSDMECALTTWSNV